jgi:hypothetical protein
MILCALARSDSSISISISPTVPPTDKYSRRCDGLSEIEQRVPAGVHLTGEVRLLNQAKGSELTSVLRRTLRLVRMEQHRLAAPTLNGRLFASDGVILLVDACETDLIGFHKGA